MYLLADSSTRLLDAATQKTMEHANYTKGTAWCNTTACALLRAERSRIDKAARFPSNTIGLTDRDRCPCQARTYTVRGRTKTYSWVRRRCMLARAVSWLTSCSYKTKGGL